MHASQDPRPNSAYVVSHSLALTITGWMATITILIIFYLSAAVTGSLDSVSSAVNPENEPSTTCDDSVIKIDNGHSEKFVIDDFNNAASSDNSRKLKRKQKRQTPIVGAPCQENIDCHTTDGGAYCDTTKRCDCLPSYVDINGYCWAKRKPGNSCQYNEQCTAASANTFCDQDGLCKCTNGLLPFTTVDGDGPFCLFPGECPTNGANSKLRDPDTGVAMKCGGTADFDCKAKDRRASAQEMYTCICSNATTTVPFKPCAFDENGYCCPSRASTCIQPMDEGTTLQGGIGGQRRWWYNSVTRSCQEFAYKGTGGNGNNFQTKALCETYCKTVCDRGAADMRQPRCSSGGSCSDNRYQCQGGKVSEGYCCPKVDFICGSNGGIPNLSNLLTVPDPGDKSYHVRAVGRWSYDSSVKTCTRFVYEGYGGTFNSFHSEAECLSFCLSGECPSGGEPLRDSHGMVMNCGSGGSSCPMKYECTTSGYCCPTINFLCGLAQAIGGCNQFVKRWWFNPKTRNCEEFTYSGCQGNDNNFGSYSDCMARCTKSAEKPTCPHGEPATESGGAKYIICSGLGTATTACPADYYCHYDGVRHGCCPTRTKTCTVDVQDPGTLCVTPVARWYYDSNKKSCDTFTYNGCDGNSNNFATKIDCQDYCGVGGCPEGGEPYRDTSNGMYRVCGLGGSQCPSGYKCSIVTVGSSTRNNYCCPSREYICTLTQEAGSPCGTSTLTRYHFNISTRSCESFVYNGCDGNRNNFASADECMNYCSSAGCPQGEVALQDTAIRKAVACDPAMATSCPANYKCMFSITLQQGVCCGSSGPLEACPAGKIAYMDVFTNTPLQCQPNVADSCPNGIFCQYNFVLSNSFCCGPLVAPCMQGGDPYLDTNGQPRQCTPGVVNVCPPSYACQSTNLMIGEVASATGYCCGESNVCGSGYVPYISGGRPIPCVVNQQNPNCPPPSACRHNTFTGLSYCCTRSLSATTVCAIGKQPYLLQGLPTLCTPSSLATECPAGYSCDFHNATGSYYCCRAGAAVTTTARCPAPYVPLQPIRFCSPGVTGECPLGFCTWDPLDSRYICCGMVAITVTTTTTVAGYCPLGTQPYLDAASGRPKACVLGSLQTGCPIGYGCSFSRSHRNYYCCARRAATASRKADFGCPHGSAFVYPGTRAPLVCSRWTKCPKGYSCQKSTKSGTYQCCTHDGR